MTKVPPGTHFKLGENEASFFVFDQLGLTAFIVYTYIIMSDYVALKAVKTVGGPVWRQKQLQQQQPTPAPVVRGHFRRGRTSLWLTECDYKEQGKCTVGNQRLLNRALRAFIVVLLHNAARR